MIAAACACLLAACASAGGGGADGVQTRRFGDVRFGSRPEPRSPAPPGSPIVLAQAAPPPSPPIGSAQTTAGAAVAAPVRASAAASAGSVQAARSRLVAFLGAHGFQSEADARAPAVVTATRMSDRADPAGEAVCGLRALRRPAMYATTLQVQIAPANPGVRLDVQARFMELDQDVISGALSRRPCASRGLLEAEVRRAVAGAAAVGATALPSPPR